jgi:hypothetical protein
MIAAIDVGSIFVSAFRSLMFMIDSIIYGLIAPVYNLIIVLAQMPLFEDGTTIKTFADNIYSLLGIFMLFKLSFSIINSIVNPDQLFDSEKGFGKILTRGMVALVLIVAIPMIFGYAMRLQSIIVEKNIFMRLFLGAGPIEGEVIDEQWPGRFLARESFSVFLFCDPSVSDCKENDLKFFLGDLNNLGAQQYATELINKTDDNGVRVYTYWFLLSTAGGVFILAILAIFCIDIAVRTVKLAFLQVIAPIAVVSYIDPSGSKEGTFFTKWLNVTKTTYFNLFTRLAAVAFMVFIFTLIPAIFTDGGPLAEFELGIISKGLLMILLLIGILIFAKEAPKMIANLFGLDDIGISTLNPFKKIESEIIGGKTTTGSVMKAGAAATGLGIGMGRGFKNKLTGDGTFGGGFKSGFTDSFGAVKVSEGFGNVPRLLKEGTSGVRRYDSEQAKIVSKGRNIYAPIKRDIDAIKNNPNMTAQQKKMAEINAESNLYSRPIAEKFKNLEMAKHNANQLKEEVKRDEFNLRSGQGDITYQQFTEKQKQLEKAQSHVAIFKADFDNSIKKSSRDSEVHIAVSTYKNYEKMREFDNNLTNVQSAQTSPTESSSKAEQDAEILDVSNNTSKENNDQSNTYHPE